MIVVDVSWGDATNTVNHVGASDRKWPDQGKGDSLGRVL